MDISNKKLKKAYSLYETGRLKEALALCEKFLQKESCDEEALELEGKILKDLGRLEEAIITWKINAEYNDNEDAKNSLASIDEDKKQHTLSYENLSQLISEAANNQNLIEAPAPIKTIDNTNDFNSKDLKVEEPKKEIEAKEIPKVILEKEEAQKTETNTKVESSPVMEISKSQKSSTSNKAIKADVKKEEKKIVEEFVPSKMEQSSISKENEKKSPSKKLLYTSAGLIIAAIVIIGGIYISTNSSASHKKKPSTTTEVQPPKVPESPKPTEPQTPQKLTEAQGETVINNLTTAIESNSIDTVNKLLQENPIDTIPANYTADYNKAVTFMETQGVNYYYTQEMQAYNDKNYQDAINYFNSAKPYYKNFEAAPTMLFTAASSYEALNETAKAMDTYKEYLNEFPNSQYYTQECLYYLATYYKDNNNLTTAKQYASELVKEYPNSMYNNDNIKAILNN